MRRDFARFSEEPGCLTYCANAVWGRRVCGSGASNDTCSSRSIKRSIGFGNGSHHDARLQRSVSSLVVAPPASGYRPEIVTSVKNAIEAPLSEDRGFTLTVRQLFQGAKPPERHRPYKVCAADLLIRWSAPKGHRTPETIHAELDKRAKKEALSLFSR